MRYELVRHKDEEPRSIRINIPAPRTAQKTSRSNQDAPKFESYIEFVPDEARIQAWLKVFAIAFPIIGFIVAVVMMNGVDNTLHSLGLQTDRPIPHVRIYGPISPQKTKEVLQPAWFQDSSHP